MRILLVNDKFLLEASTTGTLVNDIAGLLRDQGHTVGVLTTLPEFVDFFSDKVVEEHSNGLEIYKVAKPTKSEGLRFYSHLYNPWVHARFLKVVDRFKPDMVHFHNIHQFFSYSVLRVAKQRKLKTCLTIHDVIPFNYGKLIEFIDPTDLSCPKAFNYKVTASQQIKRFGKLYNPFRRMIVKHYLKYPDKKFAVSSALQSALKDNGIDGVQVLHNGVPTEKWENNGLDIRAFEQKYGLHGKKVVAFGGRLSNAKGGVQILNAMKIVIAKMPEAVLLVIGKKEGYAEKMLKQAVDLGVEKSIIITGWLKGDELRSAYYRSNLVVVPSICFDSFPTTNLEAMLCGKPVVATCFGGSREMVLDGETGFIINPFDETTFSSRIIELLEDDKKSDEFGAAGRKRILENFSLQRHFEDLMAQYQEMLGKKE